MVFAHDSSQVDRSAPASAIVTLEVLEKFVKRISSTRIEMKIIPFEDRLATAFGKLNRDWLDHFALRESADDRHLDAPRESIIARKGQIFFAVEGDEVLGTCAAIPHGDGVFEMAKLAVAPSARGKGIGRQLARSAIDFARGAGAKKVVLESNHKLATAVKLYESMGFVHAPLPSDASYETADVYMELDQSCFGLKRSI
jgi:ribosomal protein S18 acetylase RimI-like enzyme